MVLPVIPTALWVPCAISAVGFAAQASIHALSRETPRPPPNLGESLYDRDNWTRALDCHQLFHLVKPFFEGILCAPASSTSMKASDNKAQTLGGGDQSQAKGGHTVSREEIRARRNGPHIAQSAADTDEKKEPSGGLEIDEEQLPAYGPTAIERFWIEVDLFVQRYRLLADSAASALQGPAGLTPAAWDLIVATCYEHGVLVFDHYTALLEALELEPSIAPLRALLGVSRDAAYRSVKLRFDVLPSDAPLMLRSATSEVYVTVSGQMSKPAGSTYVKGTIATVAFGAIGAIGYAANRTLGEGRPGVLQLGPYVNHRQHLRLTPTEPGAIAIQYGSSVRLGKVGAGAFAMLTSHRVIHATEAHRHAEQPRSLRYGDRLMLVDTTGARLGRKGLSGGTVELSCEAKYEADCVWSVVRTYV